VRTFTLILGALLIAACGDDSSRTRAERDSAASAATPDTARNMVSDTGLDSNRATAPWTVSLSSYGPIELGSPVAAVLAALGAPPPEGEGSARDACHYIGIPDEPSMRALRLMVVNDSAVRIDVDSLSVATRWDDRVGDAEQAVLARHAGHVSVEPHKYTGPEGHYLIVTAPHDTLHRLVFETDGKRVTSYRAGLRPYVDWVEGCS
jgi:hypothetical protein